MIALLEKYAAKMVSSGIADQGSPLLGGLDDTLEWNRQDPAAEVLEEVVAGLSINSILFSRPASPYREIIDYLSRQSETIRPHDSETRTFLHDLPVVKDLDAGDIIRRLRERKSVIIPDMGIITWGTVSPEQAYISYSSTCFACFVKFFTDYLRDAIKGTLSHLQRSLFHGVVQNLKEYPEEPPDLMEGPFSNSDQVLQAICQAGRSTVELGLVDSFFGNVSMLHRDSLFISQTTSSLDELEGHIVSCPVDGSSCVSIVASSEFRAHLDILRLTGKTCVLHGHPRFSVIMSLHCPQRDDCSGSDSCHVSCPASRQVRNIPVVPGEVGTGPRGLCNTLPPAMQDSPGAIVYGHGLFTASKLDFREAFANMLSIERTCREEYFGLLAEQT